MRALRALRALFFSEMQRVEVFATKYELVLSPVLAWLHGRFKKWRAVKKRTHTYKFEMSRTLYKLQ